MTDDIYRETVVIDATGQHVYDYYLIWYAKDGGGRKKPERWSGKRVYVVKHSIAYVLREPPPSIKGIEGLGHEFYVLEDAKPD